MKNIVKLKLNPKVVVALLLIFTVFTSYLIPEYFQPNQYKADTTSSTDDSSVRAFLFGNCSITYDFVGSDDDPNTPADTYRFQGSGSTLTYHGSNLTSTHEFPEDSAIGITYNVTIPKKVGNFEVIGIKGVYNASLNQTIDGAPITYDSMKTAFTSSFTTKPFDWPVVSGSKSLVMKGVGSTGSTYGFNFDTASQASQMTVESVFKYASKSFNVAISPTGPSPSSQKATLTISNASLHTGSNGLNDTGVDWDTTKDLEMLIDDALKLQDALREYAGNNDLTPEQLMSISIPEDKRSLFAGQTKSNTYSYSEWLNYWNKQYLQSEEARTKTLPGIWKMDSKYVNEDKSYAGPKTTRVYYPYLIELDLKKTLNLELVTSGEAEVSCSAEFLPDEDVISIKIIGNLENHPSGEDAQVDNEVVNLIISNVTNADTSKINQDTKDTVVGDIKLNEDSPGLTYKYQVPIDSFPTPPTGCKKDGKFFKFPIPDDLPPTDPSKPYEFYIRAEINYEKDPEESTYDDNVFRKIVKVSPIKPDMLVESATGGYEADSPSLTVPVNVTITTNSNDCSKINDKYPAGSKVEYIIKAPDGSVVKEGTYQHKPLVDRVEKDGINFDATFTESEFSKTYQVTVKINGGKDGTHDAPKEDPDEELTYENNEKTFPITVKRKQTDKPSPSPTPTPSLPPYTKTYACFYIDNKAPSTNSKILTKMGTFSDEFTADLISENPAPTAVWPKTEKIGNQIAFVKKDKKSDRTKKLNMGRVISTYYKPVYPHNGVGGWINTSQNAENYPTCYSKSKNEEVCEKKLADYQTAIDKCQCYATFASWDTQKFQESEGAVQEESYDEVPWLYLRTRSVTHFEDDTKAPCMNDCCEYADIASKDQEGYSEAKHKHKDHECSKTYYTTNSDGETETHTETSFIHYQQKCGLCGANVAGGPSEVPHTHNHTEYCLEYLKSVTLEYNIVIKDLNETNTFVLDHGTAEKITRSGYGFTPKVKSVSYITDCDKSKTEGEADYGVYCYKHYSSSPYVRSPATNVQPKTEDGGGNPNGIYGIYPLEEYDYDTEPFSKRYQAAKNPLSPFNYREIFIDVDYKDTNNTDKFPVIFAIMYNAPNFKPISDTLMAEKYPKVAKLKEEFPNLAVSLGVCYTNTTLNLRGNMYDDSWAHPDIPDGNEGRSWAD